MHSSALFALTDMHAHKTDVHTGLLSEIVKQCRHVLNMKFYKKIHNRSNTVVAPFAVFRYAFTFTIHISIDISFSVDWTDSKLLGSAALKWQTSSNDPTYRNSNEEHATCASLQIETVRTGCHS